MADSTRGISRLLLIVVLTALAGVTGYVAGRFTPPAEMPVADEPSPALVPTGAVGLTQEQQDQLAAIGYSAGSEPAPEHTGVLKYDPARTHTSLNVFTSGHFPGAQLMDMDGNVLHQWQYSFKKLWPDVDPGQTDVSFWRRVHLFENGDIIAVIEPFGIFKLDKDSNLLWQSQNNAHHDLLVAPNGHIFVLTRNSTNLNIADILRPVLEEFVTELDADGKEIRRVSIIDAFKRSEYQSLLRDAPTHWDITHTNSLKLLGPDISSRVPDIQPGRFLLSVREIGTIAVLDLDAGRIDWATKGMWWRQHEASLVGPGNILLFDNRSLEAQSRVLEIDPATSRIVWSYGGVPEQKIYSSLCGLAARLPNGNTLITESLPGRVLEVTPEHEVVWEFVNPNRATQGVDVIATIFDFQRLPVEFKPQWLAAQPAEAAS